MVWVGERSGCAWVGARGPALALDLTPTLARQGRSEGARRTLTRVSSGSAHSSCSSIALLPRTA